jgi:hypothetical protein
LYPVDRAKGALAETIPQFYLVLHQVAVGLEGKSLSKRGKMGFGYRDVKGSIISLAGHGGGRWDCLVRGVRQVMAGSRV